MEEKKKEEELKTIIFSEITLFLFIESKLIKHILRLSKKSKENCCNLEVGGFLGGK